MYLLVSKNGSIMQSAFKKDIAKHIVNHRIKDYLFCDVLSGYHAAQIVAAYRAHKRWNKAKSFSKLKGMDILDIIDLLGLIEDMGNLILKLKEELYKR